MEFFKSEIKFGRQNSEKLFKDGIFKINNKWNNNNNNENNT